MRMLPWLASPRSGFLSALDYFWNIFASRQRKLILVICGSAASWMIVNVLHHKGGLHNRVTRSIALKPFNLGETAQFLQGRGTARSQPEYLTRSLRNAALLSPEFTVARDADQRTSR